MRILTLVLLVLTFAATTSKGAHPDNPKAKAYESFVEQFRRFTLGNLSLWSAPTKDDLVEDLVDGTVLKNIFEMEKLGLRKAELEKQPWSDSYWPMSRGLVGNRYADANFPSGHNWAANFNYVQSNPAWSIYSVGGGLDALAPSEKYDLLLGDSGMSLTRTVWAKGQYYQETYGMVESWMGLCHGWAPASYMYPAPERSVIVTSQTGRQIRFYPSDVKALASLAWGTTRVVPKFVGVKCKKRYPQYDEYGRIIEEFCLDSNASTWHAGVVSQLGVNKRSLVMDATYNYEVWNHSIISYEYTYFNPQTLEPSTRLNKAIMPVSQLTADKYKNYRSPEAVSVVGVEMKVIYNAPLRSNHSEHQSNLTKTTVFVYDLELNQNGDVVGGEWHTNNHPDFLWTPVSNTRPLSIADDGISATEWDGVSALPANWVTAGKTASNRGQPLAAIVDRLVEMSKMPEEPVLNPEGGGGGR